MPQCRNPLDVSGYRFNIPEPVCAFEAGHEAQHPCGVFGERVGEPCRFCGKTLASPPCTDCWMPVPGNLADAKALFALGGFSLG
jgi:hypothetical protein